MRSRGFGRTVGVIVSDGDRSGRCFVHSRRMRVERRVVSARSRQPMLIAGRLYDVNASSPP